MILNKEFFLYYLVILIKNDYFCALKISFFRYYQLKIRKIINNIIK